MTIGERIKNKREELALSQTDLAKRMGLSSRSTICKVEKGNEDNLTTDRIAKFAKALGVTPGYLMGWEDNLTESSAVATANLMKVASDAVFFEKYYALSEEGKKEAHVYVDFLLSKKSGDENQ